MPRASRIAFRMALCWLVLGMALGAAVAGARSGYLPGSWFGALPVHTGALLIGWFAQVVFAVAFWMLPKHPTEKPRGDEGTFLAGVVLLNLALAARAVSIAAGSSGATVVATAAVPVAFALCATQVWPRVKPFADPLGARSK